MGLWDWLFGKKPPPRSYVPNEARAWTTPIPTPRPAPPPERWKLSESGNPTFTLAGITVTVFQQDGGWKYCIAQKDDFGDDLKEFSKRFPTEDGAKVAAMAAFLDLVEPDD